MSSKRGGKGQPKGRTYGPKPTLPPNVVIPPQAPEIPPVIEIQQPPQVVQPPEERRRRRDEFENVPEDREAEFFGQELTDWERELNNNPEQFNSLYNYTGSFYKAANSYLRKTKKSDYAGYSPTDLKARIKEIDTALSKFDLKNNIMVYRGSTNHLIGGAKTVDDVKKIVGSVVRDKGFMSTSTRKSSAFSDDVHYEIKVPKGKDRGAYVGGVSHFGHEKEFLLNRGTQFKVLGAREGKYGKLIVQLEVVGRKKS